MSDSTRRRRLGKFHWIVLGVWFVLAGWLLVSIVTSVVGALYFGDGPVERGEAVSAPATGPDGADGPPRPTEP
ncbi:MAG: hypothetical protein ACQEXJ_20915 [Myxococcota bacterium]